MSDHKGSNEFLVNKELKNGKSLIIRTAIENDASELINLMKLMDVETRFLAREPEEFSFTEEQEVSFINSTNDNPNAMFLISEVDGKIIGNCSVGRISNSLRYRHRASMGIAVSKAYWGNGIGQEMMKACIAWCKKNKIEQLELDVVSGNSRALTMYESFGFKNYGVKKNALKYGNGEYADEIYMILEF